MSSVPFALGEAAVSEVSRRGSLPKPPPKRRIAAAADRKLNPEPR